MFSGIHSLFSRKKHQRSSIQTEDDSPPEKSSSEDNFVIIERRYSDDPDITTGLYPSLNPGAPSGNLPYGMSPSLPDIRPGSNVQKKEKEGLGIDLLHGVPFVLASYIDLISKDKDKKFAKFLERTEGILSEELTTDGYNYDFNLEHKILEQFET